MKAARFLLTALFVAAFESACADSTPLRAQETGSEPNPVHWTLAAFASGFPLQKGATVATHLHAAIAPGWHVYSLYEPPGGPTPMRITLPMRVPFTISGNLDAPPPRSAIDPGFGTETHFYTGNLDVAIPLRATRKTAGPVAIDVLYQACTRETCLPPSVDHLTAAVVAKAKEEQP